MEKIKKTSNNVINLYKKNSIFFSYWKKFLAILIVPIIIVTSILMFFYNRTIIEQRNTSSVQFFSTVSNAMDTMIFYETDNFFNQMLAEPGFQRLIDEKDFTSLSEYSKKALNDIQKSLISYKEISNYITNIQVHFKKSGYVVTALGNNFEKNFKNENWYNTNISAYRMVVSSDKTKSFYICYNLYSENKIFGKFIFTVSPEFIYSTKFNENITTYDIILTDKDNNILFTTSDDFNIKDFRFSDTGEMKIHTKNSYDYITKKIEDINVYVRIKYDCRYHWEFIMICIFSIIASILLSAFIAYCVALISYKTIIGIMYEFNETTEFNENHEGQIHEIDYIIGNITEMKNKNLTLEQELITNFANLNNLQLEMLQMQITPHFLFNVLNNINFIVMAQNGLDNPISDLIYKTSAMLTSTLDTSKFFIDLKGEVELCENYIEIQKVAYNNIFAAYWEIDEKLFNRNVPKFIIQSILENAFKHGVKSMSKEDKPYIKITVTEEKGEMVFKIINNTNHADNKNLEDIRMKLKEEVRPNKTQIGLLNLNKRIKIIYGRKYGCDIYAKDDTIITVAKIPSDE